MRVRRCVVGSHYLGRAKPRKRVEPTRRIGEAYREIHRLALEDPSLQQAIVDYITVEQEYNDARRSR